MTRKTADKEDFARVSLQTAAIIVLTTPSPCRKIRTGDAVARREPYLTHDLTDQAVREVRVYRNRARPPPGVPARLRVPAHPD